MIVFRGLGGEIFSTGMNRLGEKIEAECKIEEPLVTGYEHWHRVYDNIKTAPYQVILIGHSFGALACYKIISLLKHKKFPLVVTFDYSPYYSGLVAHLPDGIVPSNVTKAINFYQEVDPLVRGVRMERSDKTETNIQNVLTKYAHVEIDKADELHKTVINAIKGM